MNHYPKGYEPQTYGEKEIADQRTTEQIQREIDRKENMKKNDPERYHEIYCGL